MLSPDVSVGHDDRAVPGRRGVPVDTRRKEQFREEEVLTGTESVQTWVEGTHFDGLRTTTLDKTRTVL